MSELTTKQVADRFETTTASVLRWVREGFLKPSRRLGSGPGTYLFFERDLRKFTPPPRGRRPQRLAR